MKLTKTFRDGLALCRRFRCTCGHCEDRKEDNYSPISMAHKLFAVDGFQEFPSNGILQRTKN
jgi:hypothetical protein